MNRSTTFSISTAPKRNSLHWEVGETTWGELQDMARHPADHKECGNYLLGVLEPTTITHPGDDEPCTGIHRRKVAVVSRSVIALDVDYPREGFLDDLEMTFPGALIAHTTWKSTQENPRYRLLIPVSRELAPDEYVAAAKTLMKRLGHDNFDQSTEQAERYMFKPSTANPDDYCFVILDDDPTDADELLEGFEADLSDKVAPLPSHNKRNPFELGGTIGVFNRAYDDWDLLIETFDLPYTRSGDRYQLVGATSVAGMGPIAGADGLVYSHHANDPAFGRACSAFDLVRLHLFSELDDGKPMNTPVNRLPSNDAMLELANRDQRVIEQRAAEVRGDVEIDFTDDLDDLISSDTAWMAQLTTEPRTGRLQDSVGNWDLLLEHDRVFRVLRYNTLTFTVEAATHLPWRPVRKESETTFDVTDRYEAQDYLERTYLLRTSTEKVSRKIDQVARRNLYNPVVDYLESLTWDGKPRVETCLPGVKPDYQARLIARKVMTAAVARMFNPGCKWDHTLVLYGSEGLGKSWWVDKMSRGYSASLGPLDHKDTLLTLQRSWIVTSDEGHSLRKSDQEAQKEFLTRTTDVFRLPYERETTAHPRHCVIWSTTNDETFLTRQEGNRRFLIVHCEERVDFDALTPYYIDQVWAEAVQMYRDGEPLFVDTDEATELAAGRERFVEEDALGGIIHEYLERKVPATWWSMGIEGRRQWMADRDDGFVPEGTEQIDRVCSSQVWAEALGRPLGMKRRTDLLEITAALKRLPGWRKLEGYHRLPGYGPQVVYERTDEDLI